MTAFNDTLLEIVKSILLLGMIGAMLLGFAALVVWVYMGMRQ